MRRFRSVGRGASLWCVVMVMVLAVAGRAYGVDRDATWTGNGDGMNWSDPDNWDPVLGLPPGNLGPNEFFVTIPGPSFTVNHDAVMGDNVITEFTLGADSQLNIEGGTSLTVLKTAKIGGILNAQGADFIAEFVPEDGSDDEPVMFVGNRAKVFASGGGNVQMSAGGGYSSAGLDTTTTILVATGAGTAIELGVLTTFDAGSNSNHENPHIHTILATGGGQINMSGLQSFTGDRTVVNALSGGLVRIGAGGAYDTRGIWRSTAGDPSPQEWDILKAAGSLSSINLSSITELNAGFTDDDFDDYNQQIISASDGGRIDLSGMIEVIAPNGQTRDFLQFRVVDGGNIDLSSLETVSNADSELPMEGAEGRRGTTRFFSSNSSLILPKISTLENARLWAENGGIISINNLTGTSYSTLGSYLWSTDPMIWEMTLMMANGEDSLLHLPSIKTLNARFFDSSLASINRQQFIADGGTINLSGIQDIRVPEGIDDGLDFVASNGGFFNLSSLISIHGGANGTVIFDLTDRGHVALGDVIVRRATSITLSSGSLLTAKGITATQTTTLTLADAEDVVDVHGTLNLRNRLSINASLGSSIRIGGSYSYRHRAGSGAKLEPAIIHFDGEHGGKQLVEVGAPDVGAFPGFLPANHFGMGQMVIGTAEQATKVHLTDYYANIELDDGPLEAIYLGNIKAPAEEQLEGLIIHAGSMLFTGTRSLYTNTPDDADGLELVSIAEEFEAAGSNRIAWGDGTIVLSADMDDNGVFDAFDVDDFEHALANPDWYLEEHPDVDLAFLNLLGDLDGDSVMDAFDVDEFEALLAGARPAVPGALQSVPEPTTALLLGMAGLFAGGSRPRRKQA